MTPQNKIQPYLLAQANALLLRKNLTCNSYLHPATAQSRGTIARSGCYIKVRIAYTAVDAWKQFWDNFEKLKWKAAPPHPRFI